jgi:hypothetical protein
VWPEELFHIIPQGLQILPYNGHNHNWLCTCLDASTTYCVFVRGNESAATIALSRVFKTKVVHLPCVAVHGGHTGAFVKHCIDPEKQPLSRIKSVGSGMNQALSAVLGKRCLNGHV